MSGDSGEDVCVVAVEERRGTTAEGADSVTCVTLSVDDSISRDATKSREAEATSRPTKHTLRGVPQTAYKYLFGATVAAIAVAVVLAVFRNDDGGGGSGGRRGPTAGPTSVAPGSTARPSVAPTSPSAHPTARTSGITCVAPGQVRPSASLALKDGREIAVAPSDAEEADPPSSRELRREDFRTMRVTTEGDLRRGCRGSNTFYTNLCPGTLRGT